MFMKSVLYTNPFVSKKIFINNEFFKKQGIIIANHTSFLDILVIGMLHPKIIIGRWPIRGKDDLKKIKLRSIQYVTMDTLIKYEIDLDYLDNALVVAGNYSDNPQLIPVTPVWTSKWLMDKLKYYL